MKGKKGIRAFLAHFLSVAKVEEPIMPIEQEPRQTKPTDSHQSLLLFTRLAVYNTLSEAQLSFEMLEFRVEQLLKMEGYPIPGDLDEYLRVIVWHLEKEEQVGHSDATSVYYVLDK